MRANWLALAGVLLAVIAVLAVLSSRPDDGADPERPHSAEPKEAAPRQPVDSRADANLPSLESPPERVVPTEPEQEEPTLPSAGREPPAQVVAAAAGPTSPLPVRVVSGLIVRASDGTPLAGARVRPVDPTRADADGDAEPQPTSDDPDAAPTPEAGSGPWASFVESDEEGHFRHEAVPVVCRILAVSFAERVQEVELVEPGDVTDLRVVFDSGFIVQGTVVDVDGAPIDDARVTIGHPAADVATDAGVGGWFELRDVRLRRPAASIECAAEAPWYERGVAHVLVPDHPSAVPQVRIELTGAGAIRGRVLEGRVGVQGAEVRLRVRHTGGHGETPPGSLRRVTDEEGRYLIEGVAQGTYLVECVHDDFAPRWIGGVVVAVAEETWLDIAVDGGASLSGRVTDAAGTPVPGARVFLERIERWDVPSFSGTWISGMNDRHIVTTERDDGTGRSWFEMPEDETTTDERGRYELRGLSVGEKRVTVTDTSARGLAPAVATVELVGAKSGFDFLLPEGRSVSGRVVDVGDAPLADVIVTARREIDLIWFDLESAQTDATGHFVLSGLPDEELHISADASGYSEQSVSVRPGGADVTLTLAESPKIRGVVRDARSGEPVPRFQVRAALEGSSMSTTIEDELGSFSLAVWDEELYSVTVSLGGYQSATIDAVRPAATLDAPLEFELQPDD